jgi:hypothetical protein
VFPLCFSAFGRELQGRGDVPTPGTLIVIFVADIAFRQFRAGLRFFLPSNVREINCRDSYSSDSSPDKPH